MNAEPLREALQRIDPVQGTPALDPDSVEAVMSELKSQPTPRRRTGLLVAASVAAVVAVAGLWLNRAEPWTLKVPADADPATLSCVPLSSDLIAQADRAFAGTVTEVDDTVTIKIDRWYKGDNGADEAVLPKPDERLRGLLNVPDFTVGGEFLVTTDKGGTVGLCGPTGPRTPELEALFEEAFGS